MEFLRGEGGKLVFLALSLVRFNDGIRQSLGDRGFSCGNLLGSF